ncbi:hypothetical protein HK105_208251 [Polyrhizophydium stewartii]|uniref:G-protein coupled receptors family 2 profile 2 domain-containing protein n=1 Tax=Polyrhizophydium stewartii TaxID=2732419 RepID=A0ABR4MYB3_9FUNG
MAAMYFRSPMSFDNPTGRIILAITVTDLLDCVVKFIGRWGPQAGRDSMLCQFQGAGIQMSNFSSVLLGLAMALNAIYIVVLRGSIENIRKFEWLIIAVCICIPIPFAAVPLFLQPTPGLPMFGDADQWCWIIKAYAPYQIYLWFGWLWGIFVFNMLAYFSIRQVLTSTTKMFLGQQQAPSAIRQRMFLIKRMLAFLVAFMFVWTPSSINRIVQLSLGTPVFALSVVQSVVSPTRGMVNFLAYFYTWWYQPAQMSRSRSFNSGSASSHANSVLGSLPALKGKQAQQPTMNRIKSSRTLDDIHGEAGDGNAGPAAAGGTQPKILRMPSGIDVGPVRMASAVDLGPVRTRHLSAQNDAAALRSTQITIPDDPQQQQCAPEVLARGDSSRIDIASAHNLGSVSIGAVLSDDALVSNPRIGERD